MWTSWFVLAACAVITQSFPRPDEEYQIPVVPSGYRSQYYVLHDDGDFKYGYDTGEGAFESAVKMGSGDLTGFYGYNDAFGQNVRLDYTAGAGGFVPRSSLLPVAPQVQSAAVRYAGPVSVAGTSGVITKSAAPTRPFEEADVRSANNLDGSYSFSYDNSDSSRSESADSSNNVVGQYSFVADDGQNRQIRYRAGSATGYVAEGDSIPVAPETPAVPAVSSVVASTYSAPQPSVPSGLYGTPVGGNVGSERSGQQTFSPRGDASYSFSYETPDSAREESADSDLNVKGRYSFVADDGIQRNVNYIAGSATGFVAEGDHLPVPPESAGVSASGTTGASRATAYSGSGSSGASSSSSSSAASSTSSDASYSFKYDTGTSSRDETADSNLNVKGEYSFVGDDGFTRTVQYTAGSGTGFVAEGAHLPVPVQAEVASGSSGDTQTYSASSVTGAAQASGATSGTSGVASFRGGSGNDASYSFSYTNPDSSRSESADSDLNVRGEYSFVADDGVERQIRYKAGSDTGFVAEGSHIPVAPEVPAPVAPTAYAAPVQTLVKSAPTSPVLSHEEASVRSSASGDGGYSFSYTNSDSSRSESADANNNVVGHYSFVADDGANREIRYKAGSATGYVAEGDSLPVAPEAPSVLAASVPATLYNAPARAAPSTLYFAPSQASAQQTSGTASDTSGNSDIDGSYSFSYTNPDSSRSESADSDLNVRGEYSFVADDGIQREIRYSAGSGIGFVAEGAHIPVPVPVTPLGSTSGATGIQQTYSAGSVVGTAQTSGTTSGASGISSFRTGSGSGGGYSFSYTNPDSSRSESADASNNVVGEYSYTADDGQNRQIRYKAGSDTGFVAEGDSIPVAPEVPAAQQGSSAVFGSGVVRSGAQAPTAYSYPEPSVSFSAPSQVATTRTSSSSSSSTSSGTGHLLGNVFVRQYPVEPGRSKFGYVYTEA